MQFCWPRITIFLTTGCVGQPGICWKNKSEVTGKYEDTSWPGEADTIPSVQHAKLVHRTVPSWYTFAYISQSRSQVSRGSGKRGQVSFPRFSSATVDLIARNEGAEAQHILWLYTNYWVIVYFDIKLNMAAPA